MSESGKKLKVVYHEDHSTDVLHSRGAPVICRDCRHAGWLTHHEFAKHRIPFTCLLYSGGADPQDGDRVKLDWADAARGDLHYQDQACFDKWRELYPKCESKNQDGQCEDFIRALKQSWWTRTFRRRAMRP